MTDTTTTKIAEFDPIEAGLATLRDEYGATVWVADTPERMKAAKAAHKEIRKYRLDLEAKRKELKADSLAYGRRIDNEAKRIAAEIAEVEDPCLSAIKAIEDEEKRIKAEAARAEAERVQRCRDEIDRIKMLPVGYSGAVVGSVEIQEAYDAMGAGPNAEEFAEFHGVAENAWHQTREQMRGLLGAAIAREQEAARIANERAELEVALAKHAEQELLEKEKRDVEERERLAAVEALERESRERIAAQEREAREAREKADAEARALRAAEEQRLAEERAKVDAARREQEERERAAREAAEAEEREKRRKTEEYLDAIEMLHAFCRRFGEVAEVRSIAVTIAEWLSTNGKDGEATNEID